MVGSYRLTKLLGTGGMGSVYAGEHPAIGSRVAIKLLHSQYAQDQEFVTRFFNEAKAINIIRHDNIVQAVDYLYVDEVTPCLVLEYLEHGYTLSKLTSTPQPLSVTGPILLQMIDALSAAHEHQIIHRDLKPDNVYLTVRNRRKHFVKLMDFGIAKMHYARTGGKTQSGTVMGTALYMSPEQGRGSTAEIGPASDIYSLGVIMYHLATGTVPFDGSSAAVIAAHVGTPPTPPTRRVPDIPVAFEQLILTCLAKQPKDRFASMRELSAALHKILLELGISAELPLAEPPKAAELSPTVIRTVALHEQARPTTADVPLGVPSAAAMSVPSAAAVSGSSAGAVSASSDVVLSASSTGGSSTPSRSGTTGSVRSKGLTAQLREAHVQVVEGLNALKGRRGVDDQVRAELLKAQAIFDAHVKVEDEQLYPVLRRQAERDPKLRTILTLLGRDTEETSTYVKGFFERCLALGPTDQEELESEIETVFHIIMARQWKEDHSLFAEYDKIKGQTDPVVLIEELKATHVELVELLQKARELSDDPRRARALLFTARDMLTAHIELEDAEFYPVLHKHAAHDTKLRSTLDILAKDMAEISAFAANFFNHCTDDVMDDEDIALECEQFITILMTRLWKEENILFPRYAKVTKKRRDVVEDLISEHRTLREALDAIKTVDVASPQGREKILEMKKALLDHMHHEEQAIGGALKRAAERDEGLRQTLIMFETDLEDLYGEMIALFDRAAAGNTTDFSEAYGGVLALMKARMKREETLLFPRFGKTVTDPELVRGASERVG
jgi:serine/threonine protein kinase/hemerythrin-like domain-containing protein